VGLLDYYRQFEGRTEEEVNRELREQALQRKALEISKVQLLDLSQTTWPELPHPDVVNAITFAARSGLQHYPARRAGALRAELARRHDVQPTRIAIGHGAAQLLSAAATALMEPGQQLVCPWPSYPLFAVMARRARGDVVPVRAASADGWVDAILGAVGDATRLVAISSPNDPTGEMLDTEELLRLLGQLPEQVAVLLDEALIDLVAGHDRDASLPALQRHPRLIVFRSFSKAWGLAGLRVGYALGGPGAERLLADIEPDFGIGDLAAAGALEALRACSQDVRRRAVGLARERAAVAAALRQRDFQCTEGNVNFVWARHSSLSADELSARLRTAGVLIAPGTNLGEPAWSRIAVQSTEATHRLTDALDQSLGEAAQRA
jgi:histidinol-phosphate aminotransferase